MMKNNDQRFGEASQHTSLTVRKKRSMAVYIDVMHTYMFHLQWLHMALSLFSHRVHSLADFAEQLWVPGLEPSGEGIISTMRIKKC